MVLCLTRKSRLFFRLGSLLVAAAVFSGKREFLVAAMPLVTSLLLSLWTVDVPRCTVETEGDGAGAVEGGKGSLKMAIDVFRPLPLLKVRPLLRERPDGASLSLGAYVVSLRPGEKWERTLPFVFPGRGIYLGGELSLQALVGFGGFIASWSGGRQETFTVLPQAERGPNLSVVMAGTHHWGRGHLSSLRGEGMEFAEVRELREGEVPKDINWRATSARNRFFVNSRLPERGGDLVLVVDTLKNVGLRPHSCLDRSARAAATIALMALDGGDRVGLVDYGGFLEWIPPGRGERQAHALLGRLAALSVTANYCYRDLGELPRRGLPPQASVVVLSPLLDDRSFQMVSALAGHGFDPLILYVSPFRQEMLQEREGLWREWHSLQERRLSALRGEGLRFAEWEGESRLCLTRLFARRPGEGKRFRFQARLSS
ncbi:DUF58 domain-containing protein [Aminirod propionatiphilus]|uniref:DUF58 domain-containing protein n=1 Tax=Aminirod propionatiphilus TaxID=3415223 RepID=A0ACD1DVY5_9BACT|nr:DUF58 domain-containing protein [Synergistota bacterium]